MKVLKLLGIGAAGCGILIVGFFGYIKLLKNDTKTLCESFSASKTEGGYPLEQAVSVAEERGFTVSLTSNKGTDALFYKLATAPGLCIGTHKDGVLRDVRYIPQG